MGQARVGASSWREQPFAHEIGLAASSVLRKSGQSLQSSSIIRRACRSVPYPFAFRRTRISGLSPWTRRVFPAESL